MVLFNITCEFPTGYPKTLQGWVLDRRLLCGPTMHFTCNQHVLTVAEYAYLRICKCICICDIQIYWFCVSKHMHIFLDIYIYMCVCVYVCTCIYIYIYTYVICVYSCICVYIHVCLLVCSSHIYLYTNLFISVFIIYLSSLNACVLRCMHLDR